MTKQLKLNSRWSGELWRPLALTCETAPIGYGIVFVSLLPVNAQT